MSIVDLFNNNTKDFITIQDWMVENKNLTNFSTRKFLIPVLTSEMKNEYLNIDIEAQLVIAIKNEIRQDLCKLFTKKLFCSEKFDYLDLRKLGSLMMNMSIEKLVSMILNDDYKNLITTGYISSELQDSSCFSSNRDLNLNIGGVIYMSGILNNRVKAYVDPYMRFNDGRICLFNQVEFNIGKMKAYEAPNIGSLAPKIVIEYDIDYNVNDSKLIFVIENENSESFRQYTSLQRDVKIDNILNIGF